MVGSVRDRVRYWFVGGLLADSTYRHHGVTRETYCPRAAERDCRRSSERAALLINRRGGGGLPTQLPALIGEGIQYRFIRCRSPRTDTLVRKFSIAALPAALRTEPWRCAAPGTVWRGAAARLLVRNHRTYTLQQTSAGTVEALRSASRCRRSAAGKMDAIPPSNFHQR